MLNRCNVSDLWPPGNCKLKFFMIFINSCPITLFSGVPGVKPERFEEGMKIRHCALSLVGMMLVALYWLNNR